MSRKDELLNQIYQNDKIINDPYESNKWVERDDNVRLKQELKNLHSSDKFKSSFAPQVKKNEGAIKKLSKKELSKIRNREMNNRLRLSGWF